MGCIPGCYRRTGAEERGAFKVWKMREAYREVLESFSDIIVRDELENESFDSSELIEGKVVFVSGWRLEFMEFKSENKLKYRFHLMDKKDELVVR
ncbi:MAG: hypothetical protein ABEI53_02460 [Candidatus Magasanikbacteria bacterium]